MTTVRPATEADREAIDKLFTATWGEPVVVGHGVRYDLRTLPTLVAEGGAGVLTYAIAGDALEVVSIDNLDALRFYQRRGLRLVSVSPGAVDESRKLKPGIPAVGAYGIPIRDELVLEMPL